MDNSELNSCLKVFDKIEKKGKSQATGKISYFTQIVQILYFFSFPTHFPGCQGQGLGLPAIEPPFTGCLLHQGIDTPHAKQVPGPLYFPSKAALHGS